MFSVFQVRPSPSLPASTRRCPRAPSPTSRTSLPATSTSRRRGSSGRRCPSKMSSPGRPSQLGELEKFDCEKKGKLVARATELTSHMHQHSVSSVHFCPILPTVDHCCPVLPSVAHHCCPVFLSVAQSNPLLSSVAQFCQVFPSVVHCCPSLLPSGEISFASATCPLAPINPHYHSTMPKNFVHY